MQRDVWRVAHHPTIVTGRPRWNVKESAGAEFVDRAVFHGCSRAAGEHHANMLHVAARRAHTGSDMHGPFPSRLIRSAADGHATDANKFEFSFFECSYFVRVFKALQNSFKHRYSSVASQIWGTTTIILV